MSVLFLIPYPLESAASQRFRFEQYFELLKEEGIEYRVSPFLSSGVWRIFYRNGYYLSKTYALVRGFISRIITLFQARNYDFIFIHREAAPVGPPVFEWMLSKVLGKKIIYDFDDAIWIPNSSESNRFFSALKWNSNVFKIATYAYRISVGNTYLKNALKAYHKNVVVNPTTIDTEKLHNRLNGTVGEPPVLGWTGSHSTNKYLDLIFPLIRRLKSEMEFRFIVISDIPPSDNTDLFEFVHWKLESEIEDLLNIDIGMMPLSHDPWSEGKCGFKALQYMSLGIPALVSPVGVNEEIVDHGVNGFICRDESEWVGNIQKLILDPSLIKVMGKKARKKVIQSYSVESNRSNFLHLFAQP